LPASADFNTLGLEPARVRFRKEAVVVNNVYIWRFELADARVRGVSIWAGASA
jgi:hypothetical protein